MIKIKFLAAALVAFSLLFVSCGSTPKEEADAVKNESSSDSNDSNDSLLTDEEIDAIQDVGKKNEALWNKIEASRKAAIEAGAENANPLAFKAAEAEYKAEKSAMNNPKNPALTDGLKDLNKRYVALKDFADAKKNKARIEELEFISYGKADYEAGCKLIEELSKPDAAYGSDWYNKAHDANEKLTNVLKAGFKSLARDERNKAFKAKMKADDIKCAVSRKDDYEKYVDNFKAGDQNYVTGNPEGALNNYTKSREGFEKLFDEVSAAREKAVKAIEEAKKRVSKSESMAKTADKEKPLGNEPVEGIEAENTKLLEEDDFSAAKNAEIKIEETLKEIEEAE